MISVYDCHKDPLGPSLTEACPGPNVLAFMSLLNILVLKNKKVSGICERVVPVEEPHNKYDFIIVGGGAAGCAIIARLTEVPHWKTLGIEAGFDEPAGGQIPGFAGRFMMPSMVWNHTTKNESQACRATKGRCEWLDCKILGGN